MKPKSPPYSRRLTKWFCDCGKEHKTEALAFACECYQALVRCDGAGHSECHARCPDRKPHEPRLIGGHECTAPMDCIATGLLGVRCVPVEAKEAGDGKD